MNFLRPIADGFTEGMQLAGTLVWTVPKILVRIIGAVIVSFVLHQQFNADAVAKTIDQARHV